MIAEEVAKAVVKLTLRFREERARLMQDRGATLCPVDAEEQASNAKKVGELWLAACWLDVASGVSLGHNRAARYEEAAASLRAEANHLIAASKVGEQSC
jgi:hypothetical protein